MAIPRNLANLANQLNTDGEVPKIEVGDSKVEVTDTGSNGTITFTTDNVERARITSGGEFLVNGLTNQGLLAGRKIISVANGATITLDTGFGAHLYVSLGNGSSAVFWSPYGAATTLLNSAGGSSFSATDSGTSVRVYKNTNTSTVTLKNSTGDTANCYILAVTGY